MSGVMTWESYWIVRGLAFAIGLAAGVVFLLLRHPE